MTIRLFVNRLRRLGILLIEMCADHTPTEACALIGHGAFAGRHEVVTIGRGTGVSLIDSWHIELQFAEDLWVRGIAFEWLVEGARLLRNFFSLTTHRLVVSNVESETRFAELAISLEIFNGSPLVTHLILERLPSEQSSLDSFIHRQTLSVVRAHIRS